MISYSIGQLVNIRSESRDFTGTPYRIVAPHEIGGDRGWWTLERVGEPGRVGCHEK